MLGFRWIFIFSLCNDGVDMVMKKYEIRIKLVILSLVLFVVGYIIGSI